MSGITKEVFPCLLEITESLLLYALAARSEPLIVTPREG